MPPEACRTAALSAKDSMGKTDGSGSSGQPKQRAPAANAVRALYELVRAKGPWLPSHKGLSDADVQEICDSIGELPSVFWC